jgi:hypothetical protein
MAKININNIYEDRIKQINREIPSAISKKERTRVAKLNAEKANLEELLSQKQ